MFSYKDILRLQLEDAPVPNIQWQFIWSFWERYCVVHVATTQYFCTILFIIVHTGLFSYAVLHKAGSGGEAMAPPTFHNPIHN